MLCRLPQLPGNREPDYGFQGSVPLTVEHSEGQIWEAAQGQTSPKDAKVKQSFGSYVVGVVFSCICFASLVLLAFLLYIKMPTPSA